MKYSVCASYEICRYGLKAVKCLTEQGLNLKRAYLSVRQQTSAVDIASTLERLALPIVTTSPACKTIMIHCTNYSYGPCPHGFTFPSSGLQGVRIK